MVNLDDKILPPRPDLRAPRAATATNNRKKTQKNSTRKTTKLNRAIVGASLEEIKKKRSQKPEVRNAQREAAAK